MNYMKTLKTMAVLCFALAPICGVTAQQIGGQIAMQVKSPRPQHDGEYLVHPGEMIQLSTQVELAGAFGIAVSLDQGQAPGDLSAAQIFHRRSAADAQYMEDLFSVPAHLAGNTYFVQAVSVDQLNRLWTSNVIKVRVEKRNPPRGPDRGQSTGRLDRPLEPLGPARGAARD